MRHEVTWFDHEREPQCAPNSAYPLGIDLDCTGGQSPSCKVSLPYPAKRCGVHFVKCLDCQSVVACTTAGRPDDPRSITMPCDMQNVVKQ